MSSSLRESPLRITVARHILAEDISPLQRARSASQSEHQTQCAKCGIPINTMSPRQRSTYHSSVCDALARVRANSNAVDSIGLLSIRRSPKRTVDTVNTILTTYLRRDTLPVNVVAHTLASIGDYETERRILDSLDEQMIEWLFPYYIDRLRQAGCIVHTEGHLLFADEPALRVHDPFLAFIQYECERANRYTDYTYTRPPLSIARIRRTQDICILLYPSRRIGGIDFSGMHMSTGTLPLALTQLFVYVPELRAKSCAITTLNANLGTLVHLRCLILDDNEITTIPPELGALVALETLSIADNKLTSIPVECVRGWRALRSLSFARNDLKSLPAIEIGELPELVRLDVSQNKLTDFPRALQKSSSLTFVSLMANRPQFDVNEFSSADVFRGSVLIASRLRCVI